MVTTPRPPVAHMPVTSATAKAEAVPMGPADLSQGAAELAAELLAMRQPANPTTPRAIDQSVYRKCVITAWSEITVASVCLISGVLACMLSERLFSADTIGGALGLSFGIILLPRGIRSCVRLKRTKSAIERDSTA